MDDEKKRMILSLLTKWKTTRVNKDKLVILREELYKKSEEKPMSLPALKKLVRRVVKETSQAEKIKEFQMGSFQEGATSITPITPSVSDRVFYQAIIFDLSASKKNIEKILEKLTELKEQSNKQPKQFRNALSAEVASTRRDLEKLANKLNEIERQLSLKSER